MNVWQICCNFCVVNVANNLGPCAYILYLMNYSHLLYIAVDTFILLLLVGCFFVPCQFLSLVPISFAEFWNIV